MANLQKEITQLREQLAERDAQVLDLKEQLHLALTRRFGASSEKQPSPNPNQLGLFNEAEATVEEEEKEGEVREVQVPAHTRGTKPRVSIPEHYPREEIIYDLDESEKVCPRDNTALIVSGRDIHEQLDIIPAQIKVIRHTRLKYACPCCQQHMVTAKKPKQPIEKSIASPGLLSFIATQKYCDALPLYRQSEMFKRANITLDRTNLAQWMVKMGSLVQPLINLLTEYLQQQPVLHLDETTLQVLDEPGKTAQSKSYLWTMVANTPHAARVFHYSSSRSQITPTNLLSEETQAIMVDGYGGYQPACDQHQITRLGCWAHARRKFTDAKKAQPNGKTGKADQAIHFIAKLYAVEKKITDQPPDQRFMIRQQQSKPILEKLQQWMEKSLLTVLPNSAIGRALAYLQNQWERLCGYLQDGRYPIDNNAAENAIRPFVVGRKNWLFAKSQAGAKASANLYSLVETAKANNLNPYDYLKCVFTQLPQACCVEDIEALLPWNVGLSNM